MVVSIRYRRRVRLFPGLTLNLSKNGLSSISLGRPGATVNIPINRGGKTRGTVGLPGTGLSYTTDLDAPDSGTPSKGFAPSQPTHADVLEMAIDTHKELWLGLDGMGQLFWHEHEVGLCAYLQGRDDTPARVRDAIALTLSWDRIELICRRCPDPESVAQMSRAILAAARIIHDYATDKGICQEEG